MMKRVLVLLFWVCLSSVEVRAQPMSYTVALNGASEEPANGSTGVGEDGIFLSVHNLHVSLSFHDLLGTVTAAHIHCCTDVGGGYEYMPTLLLAAAPPTIAGTNPAANANGWHNTPVTVSFACSNATSGLASCSDPRVLGEGANQSASGPSYPLGSVPAVPPVMPSPGWKPKPCSPSSAAIPTDTATLQGFEQRFSQVPEIDGVGSEENLGLACGKVVAQRKIHCRAELIHSRMTSHENFSTVLSKT